MTVRGPVIQKLLCSWTQVDKYPQPSGLWPLVQRMMAVTAQGHSEDPTRLLCLAQEWPGSLSGRLAVLTCVVSNEECVRYELRKGVSGLCLCPKPSSSPPNHFRHEYHGHAIPGLRVCGRSETLSLGTGGERHGLSAEMKRVKHCDSYLTADRLDPM